MEQPDEIHADDSLESSQQDISSAMNRRNMSRSAKPPKHVGKVRSSMGVLSRNNNESRDHVYMSDSQAGVIREETTRQREKGKIYNPDGTEMKAEDYLAMLRSMEETGQPPAIANFGWSQTAIHQLNQEEKKLEKSK